MPLLSFQVQADYDKVIRLRSEIEKLKSEMKSVNAVFDADRFNAYNKRLKEMTTEFNALVDKAAKAGAESTSRLRAMSKTVDLSNPSKELKKFDEQVLGMCKNLNGYFGFLKGKLQETLSTLNEVGSIANKVKVDDKNAVHIEELKRQNAELTSEIQRQIAAYGEQQSQFQALANAVRSNNIPALQQFTQQEDEASKRLKLDEARNSLKGVTDDMKSLASQMAEAQGDVERLESLLDSLKNSYLDDGNAIKDSQYLETEQALESAREKLVGMKKEYNEMAILQKQYSDQVQQTNGHQERLRTQIMNAREDMVKLIAAGQAGTPTFNEIVSQTGKMRRELALANAYMQYFADPDRNLATLKQSMEGASGGASLLVGVMGLFNQKSEEMEMIQTKLQSLLGIIVGLETTYAAVKKTSNVMIAIGQIQSWASAKAKAAETVATEAGTVATIKATTAQAMFNTVAKANPYLALLSIITLVVGGIYTLAKALGSETDEQKKAAEAAKEHAEEIRKQHEAWAHSVANSAAKQIMSYKNLQKKWEELGNDLKAKEKFVTDNKTAFNDLGFSVDNVTQAENLLIKNTDAVVNAIMARAKAAAYEKVATEELERQIRIELEKGTVANGAYRKNFKKGQRLSLDEVRELERESGVSLVGANSKSTKGVAFATDVEVTNENVLNNAAKKAAENRRKRYLADRTKRIQESKDKVKLIQENARQEYEAEKAAVEQTGVPQFTPTKTTSRNGGNTSDRLHAIMDKQKLDEQRRAIDLEFSTREAQIKAMQDSTDRVLAQIELDRDREEEAIRRSYEDMRLKRVEEARKLWEADPKNKGKNFYETQEYAQANTNTQEETDNRDARLKAAKANYKKALEEQHDMQVQSLLDYLKEYGTFQQQKLAIAEEYAKKIREAEGDPYKQATLERQRDEDIKKAHFESLKEDMDWEGIFNNLDRYSVVFLDKLRGQLQNLLNDPNLTPENAMIVSEKISDVDRMKEQKTENTFNWNNSFLEEQKRLQQEAAVATQIYNDAMGELLAAETDASTKAFQLGNDLSELGLDMDKLDGMEINLDKVKAGDVDKVIGNLGLGKNSDEAKKLKKQFDDLAKSQAKVTEKTKDATKAQKKKEEADDKSEIPVKERIAKFMQGLNEDAQKYLGDVPALFDKMGFGEIGEKVQAGLDGLNSATDAAAKFASGDYVGAALSAFNAVESFGTMLGIFGESDASLNEDMKKLTSSNERLQKSIDRLSDKMDEQTFEAIGDTYEMQLKALENMISGTQDILVRTLIAHKNGLFSSDDSAAKAIASSLSKEDLEIIRDFVKQYGGSRLAEIMSKYDVGWDGGAPLGTSWIAALGGMTPEALAKFREQYQGIWLNILKIGQEEGYKDPSDLFEQLADLANKADELQFNFFEKISRISFDDLESSFKEALMSMEEDAGDTAEDISKIMAQALIGDMYNSTYLKRLKEWYGNVAQAMQTEDKSIRNAQLQDLKAEYQQMMDEARQEAQLIKDMTGYTEAYNSRNEQSATANSARNFSYEQADAIDGRMTATQIAVEQGNTKKDAILAQATMLNVTMSDICSISATQSEIADDTRNILANSYLELREANDHLGKIEKAVGNIQTIAEDTKKIVDDRL